MPFAFLLALSLVQGLTEFLPVSSSAHLALFPYLFGEKDQGILIDVALHVGTLLAVLLYYRRDIWNIALGILTWKDPARRADRNLGIFIGIASIPAVLAGAAIHFLYPEGIRDVVIITFNMITFGILMGFADKIGKQTTGVHDVTLKQAFIIGCAQALALVPGVSRSGMTMTTGRFLGLKRVDAARFSFLLGIPATAGAGFLGFLELLKADNPGMWHDAALAVALAFVSGLAAIHFMMRWLKHAGLMPFVVYRVALGLFLIYFFWPNFAEAFSKIAVHF